MDKTRDKEEAGQLNSWMNATKYTPNTLSVPRTMKPSQVAAGNKI